MNKIIEKSVLRTPADAHFYNAAEKCGRHTILFLCLIFCMMICSCAYFNTVVDYEYWDNEKTQLKSETRGYFGKDGSGVPKFFFHGKRQCFYQNGQLFYEAFFQNDKPVGTIVKYYEDGKKQLQVTYDENGILDGERCFWDINGKAHYTTFRHGVGTDVVYYPTGEIRAKAVVKDNEWNGEVQCFDKSGKIIKTGIFSHGVLVK